MMIEMRSHDWHSCSKLLWPLVCVLLVHLIIRTNGPASPQAHTVTMGPPRRSSPICDVGYTPGTADALNSSDSSSIHLELYHTAKGWLRLWSRHRHGSFGITTEQVDELFEITNNTEVGAVRFVVRDGRPKALPVRFTRSIHYESRVSFWQSLLERLAWRFGLPENLDAVFWTEDQPWIAAGVDTVSLAPLFVYATLPGFFDVPIPTTEYYTKLAKKDLHELVKKQRWEDRQAKAIWRGSPTGGWYASYNWFTYPRSKLVNVSMHNPEIIDAKFLPCAWGQCADDVWPLIRKTFPEHTDDTHFTMEDYVQYKFLIDIDGNAWSSRFVDLLRTGCVVFKVASSFREYFDSFLIPYRHYIPVAMDSSDLPEKVRWAIDHDEEVKAISVAAQEVFYRSIGNGVWENYASLLLQEYSKLLPPEPSSYILEKYRERFRYDTEFSEHLQRLWEHE